MDIFCRLFSHEEANPVVICRNSVLSLQPPRGWLQIKFRWGITYVTKLSFSSFATSLDLLVGRHRGGLVALEVELVHADGLVQRGELLLLVGGSEALGGGHGAQGAARGGGGDTSPVPSSLEDARGRALMVRWRDGAQGLENTDF